ncbi:MAG: heavy-metal-associated domain-containing protein [Crocinitomicaceae bacterium]
MKTNKLYLITLISLVFSCKNQPADVATPEQVKVENKEQIVHPNKMLTAEITGMTCEQGCGGSIRKNLKAKGGVSKVEYDFVIDAEKQVCRIYFDSTKINEGKISDVVNTINEEQFKIKVLSVQDVAKK